MRLDFMKRLSTWATFGKGWSARVARVKENAIGMTRAA
jgi:lysozyme family protein